MPNTLQMRMSEDENGRLLAVAAAWGLPKATTMKLLLRREYERITAANPAEKPPESSSFDASPERERFIDPDLGA